MTTDTPNRETNSEGTQRNQENQPEQTSSNQLELSRRSAIRRLGAAGFVGSFGLTRSATANSGRWASKEGGNPGKGKPDNVPIPAGKKVPESKVVEKPKAGEHLSRFFDKKPASGKTIHYENENLTPTPEVEGWQGKTTAQLPDGEKFGYMAGDLVVPPSTFISKRG